MPIRVTLDERIVRKGLKARDLAAEVGLSETQLSLFRSGKVKVKPRPAGVLSRNRPTLSARTSVW